MTARVIAGMMKDLFTRNHRAKTVGLGVDGAQRLHAAGPPSSRSPSSTSALYLKLPPTAATSADLTRMNDQMQELGKRHRRAFRWMFALVGALLLITCIAVFLNVSRGNANSVHAGPTAHLAAALPAPKAPPSAEPRTGRAAVVESPSPAQPTEAAPSALGVSAALQACRARPSPRAP